MADDDDSVRLKSVDKTPEIDVYAKRPADAKRLQELTQPETPEHPKSPSDIAKNKTPEIDAYAKRPADAKILQERLGIKKLVFDSKEVKKSAKGTRQVDEYEYFHQLEREARRRPIPDYIEKVQKDFTIDTRSIFVDWLVKVAEKIELPSDLTHLAVSCIDRYLSVNAVDRQMLKLLGVSSMLISLTYEYKGHPCANNLCKTTGTESTELEIEKMEYEILKSLDFEMGNPTVKTFLRKFTRVAQEEAKIYKVQLEFLCDYLADLSLLEYKCLKFSPSLVAASVVFLSRYTIRPNLHPWSSAFQQESGYEPANLKECVLLIHDWQTSRKGGGILNTVRNKYKQHKFKYVSELSSPATIPDFFFDNTTTMADEEVGVCLASQRTAEAMGSLQQPPIKKLVSQLMTPEPPQPPMFMSDGVKKTAKKTSGVDIYEYLHQLEMDARMKPSPDYIAKVQKGLTMEMRGLLVDWVVTLAEKFQLDSDIVHLTISYIDRFLSVNSVDRHRLKLLGVSSMLISLKYEYKDHLKPEDLRYTSGNIYTKLEIAKMEAEILNSLKFEIGNPTIIMFLRKFTKVAQEEVKISILQLEFLGEYLAELSLTDYYCLKFLPSLVAASVVFLSIFTIRSNSHPWSSALQMESGYEPARLRECVLLIHDLQTSRRFGSLKGVRDKYKKEEFKCVSELSSPATIPDFLFDEYLHQLEHVRQQTRITFVDQLPSHLRSSVMKIMNVPADGHCGFHAIADLLEFGIDSHGRIRGGLFHELICNKELYKKVFIEHGRVEEVLDILVYDEKPAPKEHWFCLPDMGYLVASRYNVALVCIDLQMPLTYLPLRTPIPKEPKLICIGHINQDHFVKVNLLEGCPLPPVAALWHSHRSECSKGWLDFYRDRLENCLCFKIHNHIKSAYMELSIAKGIRDEPVQLRKRVDYIMVYKRVKELAPPCMSVRDKYNQHEPLV